MTDAALGSYASLAAHQLGEAVCLVKASAELLDDADAMLAEGLRGGAERVQRFVDDLLDVTSTAAADLVVERVDLDEALTAAAAGLAPYLSGAGVRLEAERLPAAAGSRVLLERLFCHLLRGALAARGDDQLVIRVQAKDAGDAVAVAMSDTGRELPADGAATAFEPFARGRGRGPLVGAGVGMAVCRLVIERHGGTITAAALPDGGTVVEFTLPRAP
jgi:signal transduction histidine kinase